MRRILLPLLVVAIGCATPRAERLSLAELYGHALPAAAAELSPADGSEVSSSHEPELDRRGAPPSEPLVAYTSPSLNAALVTFATRARAERARSQRGGPMPLAQQVNWREMNAALEDFLRRPAEETSSFDVIRARVIMEAELEEDARAYGHFPAEIAEEVLGRVTQLGLRMGELRRLQVKTVEARTAFKWPVDPVTITSLFGRRMHPITRRTRDHQGIDLAARPGQMVYAAGRGLVLRAGWNGAHGLQVEVQHDRDTVTRYSHLSHALVEPGMRVEEGDVLGLAGKTGLATGVHLHFEVWRLGKPSDPLEELGAIGSPSIVRLDRGTVEPAPRTVQGRRSPRRVGALGAR